MGRRRSTTTAASLTCGGGGSGGGTSLKPRRLLSNCVSKGLKRFKENAGGKEGEREGGGEGGRLAQNQLCASYSLREDDDDVGGGGEREALAGRADD